MTIEREEVAVVGSCGGCGCVIMAIGLGFAALLFAAAAKIIM